MDQSTISADPPALYRYADLAARTSSDLEGAAQRLSSALGYFLATCTGVSHGIDSGLPSKLHGYLDFVSPQDHWVRQVGRDIDLAGSAGVVAVEGEISDIASEAIATIGSVAGWVISEITGEHRPEAGRTAEHIEHSQVPPISAAPVPMREIVHPQDFRSCLCYVQAKRDGVPVAGGNQGAFNLLYENNDFASGKMKPVTTVTYDGDLRKILAPGWAVVWDRNADRAVDRTSGHIAIIEKVDKDSVTISQANYGKQYTITLSVDELRKRGIYFFGKDSDSLVRISDVPSELANQHGPLIGQAGSMVPPAVSQSKPPRSPVSISSAVPDPSPPNSPPQYGPGNVPFVSQWDDKTGTGDNNCGPASLGMVIEWWDGSKIDVIAAGKQIREMDGLSPVEGAHAPGTDFASKGSTTLLAQHGLDEVHLTSTDEMVSYLKAGYPVLAAVDNSVYNGADGRPLLYPHNAPGPNKKDWTHYESPHIVVVTGYNTDADGNISSVFINDPLARLTSGTNYNVKYSTFLQATNSLGKGAAAVVPD